MGLLSFLHNNKHDKLSLNFLFLLLLFLNPYYELFKNERMRKTKGKFVESV